MDKEFLDLLEEKRAFQEALTYSLMPEQAKEVLRHFVADVRFKAGSTVDFIRPTIELAAFHDFVVRLRKLPSDYIEQMGQPCTNTFLGPVVEQYINKAVGYLATIDSRRTIFGLDTSTSLRSFDAIGEGLKVLDKHAEEIVEKIFGAHAYMRQFLVDTRQIQDEETIFAVNTEAIEQVFQGDRLQEIRCAGEVAPMLREAAEMIFNYLVPTLYHTQSSEPEFQDGHYHFSDNDETDLRDFLHYQNEIHTAVRERCIHYLIERLKNDLGSETKGDTIAISSLLYSVDEALLLHFLKMRFPALSWQVATDDVDADTQKASVQARRDNERRILDVFESIIEGSKNQSPQIHYRSARALDSMRGLFLLFQMSDFVQPHSTERDEDVSDAWEAECSVPIHASQFAVNVAKPGSHPEHFKPEMAILASRIRGITYNVYAMMKYYGHYTEKPDEFKAPTAGVMFHEPQGNPCLSPWSLIPLTEHYHNEHPALLISQYLGRTTDTMTVYARDKVDESSLEELYSKAENPPQTVRYLAIMYFPEEAPDHKLDSYFFLVTKDEAKRLALPEEELLPLSDIEFHVLKDTKYPLPDVPQEELFRFYGEFHGSEGDDGPDEDAVPPDEDPSNEKDPSKTSEQVV